MTEPAYVRGIGIVSPVGKTTQEHWQETLKGATGIKESDRVGVGSYSASLAGLIEGFDERGYVKPKLMQQTDRMTRYALWAAQQAVDESGLEETAKKRPYDVGVVTAATGGAVEFGQRELQNLWAKGKEHVSAYQSFAWFYAVNTGQISIAQGFKGPSGVVVTDQAGGLDAVGVALRRIRLGLPHALAGGIDSSLNPWGLVPYHRHGELSEENDPISAYRPFSDTANGYVLGEGGAILSLSAEPPTDGPMPIAVAGYGTGFGDQSASVERVVRNAMHQAGVAPEEVGLVFPDASGIISRDVEELDALHNIWTKGLPTLSLPKTGTGRMLAGGGAADLATAALALRHQVAPPAAKGYVPPRGIDFVVERPREIRTDHCVVIARGAAKFCAAIVLSLRN